MTLDEWMKLEGRTGKWLAKQLGVRDQWVSAIRRGREKPSRHLATHIESVTDGAVPVSVWGLAERGDNGAAA